MGFGFRPLSRQTQMDLYNSFVEMLDDERLPISNLNVLDLMHEVYAIEEQQSGTGTHFVSELRNDHQRSVILEAVVEYTRCRSLIEDGIPVSPRLDAGVERRDSGFIFSKYAPAETFLLSLQLASIKPFLFKSNCERNILRWCICMQATAIFLLPSMPTAAF